MATALVDGQMRIRGLTIGPGTPYVLMRDANIFQREVRTTGSEERPRRHGSWSGAELMAEAALELPIRVEGAGVDEWLHRQQRLAAAFAPVGLDPQDVPLRYRLGAREYVLFGRPRMIEPDVTLFRSGISYCQCGFVALDPIHYAAEPVRSGRVSLPTQRGGLRVSPLRVGHRVPGWVVGGDVPVTNEGTAAAPLRVRIHGPVPRPRVSLAREDGTVQRLVYRRDLPAGRSLHIDTDQHTALLDGRGEASALGHVTWGVDSHPVTPGVNMVRFRAADVAAGAVEIETRSAWW